MHRDALVGKLLDIVGGSADWRTGKKTNVNECKDLAMLALGLNLHPPNIPPRGIPFSMSYKTGITQCRSEGIK